MFLRQLIDVNQSKKFKRYRFYLEEPEVIGRDLLVGGYWLHRFNTIKELK